MRRKCVKCDMVGNVDPFEHKNRYGHEPVILINGVRHVHRGDFSFVPEK